MSPVIVYHECDVCGKRSRNTEAPMSSFRVSENAHKHRITLGTVCNACMDAIVQAAQAAIDERSQLNAGQNINR